MPIIPWHYDRVDWLPCPDCWSERDYEAESHWVIDSYGRMAKDEHGNYLIDPDFPNLDDPIRSTGFTVDVEKDSNGKILSKWRLFKGCPTCGGAGENEVWDSPWDASSKGKKRSWADWAFGKKVIEGTGKIAKTR